VHIPDLALCKYHDGPLNAESWYVPLLAIGWLEHPYSFATGATTPSIVSRLTALIEQTRAVYRQYTFRGVHECSLCSASQRHPHKEVGWSQDNLLLPGANVVYAAPSGIVHYIEEHAYRPPQEFLDAVAACPAVDTHQYQDALRLSNAGADLPLETWSECLAKSRAFAESLRSKGRTPGSAA
jgi:hypothetical protein